MVEKAFEIEQEFYLGITLDRAQGKNVVMASSEGVGVPRDESFYFYAADRAADWVDGLFDSERRSFSRGEIDRGFKYNREHPVFMKLGFAIASLCRVASMGA